MDSSVVMIFWYDINYDAVQYSNSHNTVPLVYYSVLYDYILSFFQPLIQCYRRLKEAGLAFNLHLSENWLRHYQVYLCSVTP